MPPSRPVIQFEVYFLQDGRWTLHSRFGQSERQDAIKDAMAAESGTGFPTKVIRDTYFPDTNTNETVTIYSSPKLKAAQKAGARTPPLVKHVRRAMQQRATARAPRPTAQPVGEYIADFLTRAVVATCLSMAATALVTFMFTWLLSRLSDFGVVMSPQSQTALLSFVSIGIFALAFVAFFRVGARFKRLIRRLWAISKVESVTDTTEELIRQLRFSHRDLKPKHPSRKAAEMEKSIQEVKRQRGDPDAVEPETIGAPTETFKAPEPIKPAQPAVAAEKAPPPKQTQQPPQTQQPQQPAPPTVQPPAPFEQAPLTAA